MQILRSASSSVWFRNIRSEKRLVEQDLVIAGGGADLFQIVEGVVIQPGVSFGDLDAELSADLFLGHGAMGAE